MTDSAALLRLLEPAVRPVPTAPAGRVAQAPIEQRSFEALLDEAKSIQVTQGSDEETAAQPMDATSPTNPLRALGSCGAIENASLRGLMGSSGQ